MRISTAKSIVARLTYGDEITIRDRRPGHATRRALFVRPATRKDGTPAMLVQLAAQGRYWTGYNASAVLVDAADLVHWPAHRREDAA